VILGSLRFFIVTHTVFSTVGAEMLVGGPLVRGGTNYKGQVRRTTVRLQPLHVHRVSVETELHRLILCFV
jgi:hypothetical protein